MSDNVSDNAKILGLVPKSAASPRAEVIDLIGSLLKRAEVGEITGCAVVAMLGDGQCATAWSVPKGSSYFVALGALDYIHARMLKVLETE